MSLITVCEKTQKSSATYSARTPSGSSFVTTLATLGVPKMARALRRRGGDFVAHALNQRAVHVLLSISTFDFEVVHLLLGGVRDVVRAGHRRRGR